MNQAVVDPDELRQFASQLSHFAKSLREQSTALGGQMSRLEQTWRDSQQRKFAAEFEEQLQQIGQLVRSTEAHVPYLLRKAEQIDAYLGR